MLRLVHVFDQVSLNLEFLSDASYRLHFLLVDSHMTMQNLVNQVRILQLVDSVVPFGLVQL